MLESKIEAYLRDQVEKIGGLCYKFVSPGNAGVMDRIVMYNAETWFVETKKPGGKLGPLQQWQAKRFRSVGQKVLMLDTKPKIDFFINLIKVAV